LGCQEIQQGLRMNLVLRQRHKPQSHLTLAGFLDGNL